jgi:retron-type reverse transcriptase
MSSAYWSSTAYANNTDNAWNVIFNNGNVNNNNKTNSYYVRAVRGGKCSLFSFDSVYRAYLDCRKRKRGTINALRFEIDALGKIFDLALALQQGTYRPTRSVCFVTTTPKLREIFAADFTDRIVHHLVVRELERIWEPWFIYDSYACRQGKGTHAAVNRLRYFMQQVTRSGKRPAWMIQLDIRSFFMSIDKDVLFRIFENKLKPRNDRQSVVLLYLLQRIIYNACEQDFIFKGAPEMLAKVPPHKSLLKVAKGKGLPIGNLTSQFFANVYLNELDHFVKHHLRCRHYVRYVDDFILLSPDRNELSHWQEQIASYLAKRLLLQLKQGWRIQRVSQGSDFLKYIVRSQYVLVRNRVVNQMKSILAEFKAQMVTYRANANGQTVVQLNMAEDWTVRLMQTLASYLGHFKHADSYSLINTLFLKNKWLGEYFTVRKARLIRKHVRKGVFRSLKSQVSFFRAGLKDTLLLFQVGKFMEAYDADAMLMNKFLGCKVQKEKRGMSLVAGFPMRFEQHSVFKLLEMGKDIAVVKEGQKGRIIRQRHVRKIYRIVNKNEKEM